MQQIKQWFRTTILVAFVAMPASAPEAADCSAFHIDSLGDEAIGDVTDLKDSGCVARKVKVNDIEYLLPDPKCTPGAKNPTLTAQVLRDPDFTTKCVRDNATPPKEKNKTYDNYATEHPDHNTGAMQYCELDHLVSLELGGADTLDNIWPQCGPEDVVLRERFFKQKDTVENYLAKQVREGRMDLDDAQKGIASDWTQYLDDALHACGSGTCR
jgi:hypothetical protein